MKPTVPHATEVRRAQRFLRRNHAECISPLCSLLYFSISRVCLYVCTSVYVGVYVWRKKLRELFRDDFRLITRLLISIRLVFLASDSRCLVPFFEGRINGGGRIINNRKLEKRWSRSADGKSRLEILIGRRAGEINWTLITLGPDFGYCQCCLIFDSSAWRGCMQIFNTVVHISHADYIKTKKQRGEVRS